MTKEDMEEASGRGDRKDWFEGGWHETRQVEKQSVSIEGMGVNPAIYAKGTTLNKN